MFGFLRRKTQEAGPAETALDETAEGQWEPGIVEFALDHRMFRIVLMPGSVHGDGGIAFDVEMAAIPFELRMPNTRIMALDGSGKSAASRSGKSAAPRKERG